MADNGMRVIGRTGLNRYGGHIYEELHPKLQGSVATRIYMEMRDNDPIIGAILFLIRMLIRQSKWTVEPAGQRREDLANAKFLAECKDDMSHTWEDFISEVLSMLIFGWSYFEIVYKRRAGDGNNPAKRSKYTDGKIGWRKIELRAQETLEEWEFDDEGGIKGMWQNPPPDFGRVFIPIEKALLFRTETTKNSPEGRSILRNAYTSWYYLKNIRVFEAIGIERDLAGLPVLQVPPHILLSDASSADQTLLADLKEMVSEIKRDEREGLIVPAESYTDSGGTEIKTGYKFGLVTSGGSRQIDTNQVIKRYESRIAMTTLAEFILLGMDKVGSFALASSKTNMFAVSLGAWLDMIASVVNRYAVTRLFALNGLPLDRLPRFIPGDIENIPLDEIGKYISDLTKVGVLIPDEALQREVRRIAKLPESDDALSEELRRMDVAAPKDGDEPPADRPDTEGDADG